MNRILAGLAICASAGACNTVEGAEQSPPEPEVAPAPPPPPAAPEESIVVCPSADPRCPEDPQ